MLNQQRYKMHKSDSVIISSKTKRKNKMLLQYLLPAVVLGIASCDDTPSRRIMWVGGPIEFPDKTTKALYKNSGQYISKNMLASRFQIYGDTAYVAFPRYKAGVAVTLANVSLIPNGCEATFKPFPCFLTQEIGNCQAIQNAVSMTLDVQNILWVLDTGVIQAITDPIRTCPAKVVGFSVPTGQLVKTIDLSGLVTNTSRLQNMAVEYTSDGKPFIYISDGATRSILVYDVLGNRGYRVVLPRAVSSGCNNGRDVLYLVLVRKDCGNSCVVFSYLCGRRFFGIRTDILRSGSVQGNIVDLGLKPTQLFVTGTDLGSSIFVRTVGTTEILRWDTNQPLTAENLIPVYRPETNTMFSSQVAADPKLQRMRIMEGNYPDYVADTVGTGAIQDINVIEGTSC